jgi:quercetin dioxygenase-like cupin family protein
MNPYRVDLASAEWTVPLEGVRHKTDVSFGRRLRLIEYTREMPIHWCSKGHWGYVLEGRFEIEFDGETIVFEPGDGICIPDGEDHRHRGKVLTDVVKVFFVEEA